jgi:hypothetical protein
MSLRRLISILGVTFFVTGSLIAAPAKKKAPTPVAPAKEPAKGAKGSGSGAGSGSATGGGAGGGSGAAAGGGSGDAAGSAVQPIEDTPPSDMQGTNENPDDPHGVGMEKKEVPIPVMKKATGYPLEEALRPITLPANMSEISIAPHAQFSPFMSTDALHARYGITPKVQVGLTYVFAGIYDRHAVDPGLSSKYSLHSGKAFGVDVTVLLQNWIGVKVGVPFYVSPLAVSFTLGTPIKFTFGDKYAIGGLDDLLNITLDRFAPSFYQEFYNARGANNDTNHTEQSRGHIRFSFYGIYQQSQRLAVIGRLGLDDDLGPSGGGGAAGTASGGGTATFIRAGLQYTVRRYFDAGFSLGWDDLSVLGSFGPQLTLALRI